MLTVVLRRQVTVLVALAAAAVLWGSLTPPAFAQGDEEVDEEGGSRTLREQLDDATSAYQDAKAALDQSSKRELKLVTRLEELNDEQAELVDMVQVLASTAYRTGRIGAVSALLNSGSPSRFLDRVATVDMLAAREDKVLARLSEITASVEEKQAEIAAEIAVQEQEVDKLNQAVEKAEDALFAVGGGSTGQFVAYDSPLAEPAPRNADGSFPDESCSEDDPTTSACVSPRLLHAYNEARLFGFTRYTSCFRNGTFGEHPLGRACDFSSEPNGFGGVASGSDKEYGDRLASFFVTNASRLGVQYVIWFKEIWLPGSGWKTYSGQCGDPNCDHTNHVHLSVR